MRPSLARLALSLFCGLAPLLAARADWQDDLVAAAPGKFAAPRPQHDLYRFGWSGLTAAEAEVDLTRPRPDQLEIAAKLRTVGTARALWQMNAEHLARCTWPELQPLWVRQTEVYKKKTEKIRLEFTPLEVMRYREVTPPETPPPKPRRFEVPNLRDLQSALFLVRSQRLAAGDVYRFVVYPAKGGYLTRVTVLGRENVRVAGVSRPAIKMQIGLQQITKALVLEPHPRFKNAWAWLSDDADRSLIKAEAQVFIGSVWLELQSQTFTDQKGG